MYTYLVLTAPGYPERSERCPLAIYMVGLGTDETPHAYHVVNVYPQVRQRRAGVLARARSAARAYADLPHPLQESIREFLTARWTRAWTISADEAWRRAL